MVCIYCGGSTSVLNSRKQKRSNATWRRRSCNECMAIYTTLEKIDYTTALIVHSPKQPTAFSRDKLYISIYESCKHKKNAHTSATMLTDTVIKQLYSQIHNATIPINAIRDTTLKVLHRFDEAAGVYYKAFHPVND